MGAEYELKYRTNEAVQKSIEETHPSHWVTIAMETTYYDTPSGSLSARGYMLRRRLENGTSVCTLKTSGKGNLRGEWEVACEDITTAISELCKLNCPADLAALCEEGLIPICGARFSRKAQVLTLPDCTAELAMDSGILFSRKKKLTLCEIELELKAGSKEALDAFGAAFAAKYGLEPEEKSKFARALALNQED